MPAGVKRDHPSSLFLLLCMKWYEIGWQVAPCWVSKGNIFIICIRQVYMPGLQGPFQMVNMLLTLYCIVLQQSQTSRGHFKSRNSSESCHNGAGMMGHEKLRPMST